MADGIRGFWACAAPEGPPITLKETLLKFEFEIGCSYLTGPFLKELSIFLELLWPGSMFLEKLVDVLRACEVDWVLG